MAEGTKIAIKLEEESKPIKKMCEKLMDSINYELDKGIENVDTKELGEAIDMIKDLYEAKKEMYEACYYKQIMEAMEEHDFEDEDEIEDEGRRGYRGQPRSQSGRFMSRGDGRRSNRGRGGRRGYEDMMMYDEDWDDMEYQRDMDRNTHNRMYYTDGNMGGTSSSGMNSGSMVSQGARDMREGRSGQSRRGYMESKEMHKGNSAEDKQQKMKELEHYMKDLSEDVTEMISEMSPEEKSLMKQKMQVLMQKIG